MKQEKPGTCPISFFWRGRALGKKLMVAGLLVILLGIIVKIVSLMFWPVLLSIQYFFAIAGVLWLIGKIISVKNGAQKRTRTSTKKFFTRT